MKKGLIVASFGTTHKDTYELCIKPIVDMAKNHFSDYEITEAFTSRIVKGILSRRDGVFVNDEKDAVNELASRGVDVIYIAPLHLLKGYEYEKLLLDGVKVGSPLFDTIDDIKVFAKEVDFGLDKNDALLLMGHGSDHSSDWVYKALELEYRSLGYDKFFIATVEGETSLEFVISKLKEKNIKKIYLRPLMLVAGDHAKNDMAGNGENSWKNLLQKEGIEVETILEGLGEISVVRNIYLKKMIELVGE